MTSFKVGNISQCSVHKFLKIKKIVELEQLNDKPLHKTSSNEWYLSHPSVQDSAGAFEIHGKA